MHKYFKELEQKDSYKTYFQASSDSKSKIIGLKRLPFTKEILEKIAKISKRVDIVNELIASLDEDEFMSMTKNNMYSFDEWQIIGEFFNRKTESYESTKSLYQNLDNNMWNTYYMLQEIEYYITALRIIFPQYKQFFDDLNKEIAEILKEIKMKSRLVISKEMDNVEVLWPDAWYITPNGYLYNTGLGHKQGNLIYPLYYEIFPTLSKNGNVISKNYSDKIKEIIERGYVTEKDIIYYANLTYLLPTVSTKETEREKKREEWLFSLDDNEYNRIINQPDFVYPTPERSYQPRLLKLIIGHLAAEMCLYNKFSILNDSENKEEVLDRILQLSNHELDDLLVKFCGFNKVSSVLPRTITTSSLNGIEDFEEYLKRGWDVEIIPGIVYDAHTKQVSEVDFSSPFISKHLSKKLDNYNGKGKVLVYSDNHKIC